MKKRGAFGASLVNICRNHFCLRRRKLPLRRQHFLKQPPGTAGTQVISPEFFLQDLFAMDNAIPFFDAGFGGESLLPLACYFKTTPVLRFLRAWHTSFFRLFSAEVLNAPDDSTRSVGSETVSVPDNGNLKD